MIDALDEEYDPQSDAQRELVNAAWAIAKRCRFDIHSVAVLAEHARHTR
jgi:hypothetical protein